jgi:hypothetical protein
VIGLFRIDRAAVSTVIALWLGHADTGSTQQYIHADMTIKERALALLTPPTATPGRYRPTDRVLSPTSTASADYADQRAHRDPENPTDYSAAGRTATRRPHSGPSA